ncbi:acid-sensing ion channel 1-like [Clytia hemisphaerica]|uniref:Uncharacterized protein n=1 Tax=Clytia hemisphaerica TaxID=252671 RepID=A0A7M5VF14_9CNID|eukprot:TCONS_00001851-protein
MRSNKVMPQNDIITVKHGQANDLNSDISFKPSFFQQPAAYQKNTLPKHNDDNEKNVDEKKDKSIKELLIEFAESTSAHGYSPLASTKTILGSVVWIISMLAAYIVLILVIQPLITKYLDRPLLNKQTVVYEHRPKFPVVVFCNENPVVREKYVELLTQLNETFESIDPDKAMSHVADPSIYGHRINDSILRCDFRHVKGSCTPTSDNDANTNLGWGEYWQGRYGKCWFFNADVENPRRVTRAGHRGGLHLHFNIEQEKYIDNTYSAGLRMFVGLQGEKFDVEEKAIPIAPGKKYDIALTKKYIYRADPFNNGSCMRNQDKHMVEPDRKSDFHIDRMTHGFCSKLCANAAIRDECSCVAPSLPLEYRFKDVPFCPQGDQCLDELLEKWFDGNMKCDCNPPCEETLFSTSVYSQNYPQDIRRQREIAEGKPDPSKNLLTVSIFYEDKSFIKMEEEQFYTIVNLIADMGGQLGLFGGFSFLTVVEFTILLVMIVIHLVMVICKGKPKE